MTVDLDTLAKRSSKNASAWADFNYEGLADVLRVPIESIWSNPTEFVRDATVPPLAHLIVLDINGDYALVHYIKNKVLHMSRGLELSDEEKELNSFSEERGTVSNVRDVFLRMRGVIFYTPKDGLPVEVARSFGFPYEAEYVASSPNAISAKFQDNQKVNTYSEEEQFVVEPYYQGNVCRVWYHRDKIFFSSHKTIDNSNSTWGDSSRGFKRVFMEMSYPQIWQDLGDDKNKIEKSETLLIENLFSNSENRNLTYAFHLVHPNFASSSLMSIGGGFVLLLGIFSKTKRYDDSSNVKNLEGLVFNTKVAREYLGKVDLSGKWMGIVPMEYREADQILRNGYYGVEGRQFPYRADQRFIQSDAVMIKSRSGFYMKVYPSSVGWRNEIFSDIRNIKEGYDKFTAMAYDDVERFKAFVKTTPIYGLNKITGPEDTEDILALAKAIKENRSTDYRGESVNIEMPANREKYLAHIFTFAAPYATKESVATYYKTSRSNRRQLGTLLGQYLSRRHDIVSELRKNGDRLNVNGIIINVIKNAPNTNTLSYISEILDKYSNRYINDMLSSIKSLTKK